MNNVQVSKDCCETILQQTWLLKNSLVGYEDGNNNILDIQLKDAFKAIKDAFEKANESISFISFADTELNENNLDKWKVETAASGKFFYSAIQNNKDPGKLNEDDAIVNDYYFFKEVLAETEMDWPKWTTEEEKQLLSKPRSAQLAYVLDQSFIYRIVTKATVGLNMVYKDKEKVLTVVIPEDWLAFNNTGTTSRAYTEISYNKAIFQYETTKVEGNKVWQYDSNRADIDDLRRHIKELSKGLRANNVPIKKLSQPGNDVFANGFSRLILSLAYLSKLMNCWVESIPSTVALVGDNERCLGVFIWGYYDDAQTGESPYSLYYQLLADKLCTCYASKYIKPIKYAKQVHKEAVKSAKAAIMSRNMSHNLGSHVMFYIKQRLESFKTMVQSGSLEDLVKEKFQNMGEITQKTQMPFLVGLGRFMNYLQERQDYIATVATDYIPSKSVVNFKDSIYDELKPELRVLRHSGDASVIKASNLLLDYIAYSEGFQSSDHIQLYFGDVFNGTQDSTEVPESLRSFNVALPGGTMGRQAFFSIMENIIRNTAKHEGQSSGGGLKFQFDILDPQDIVKDGLCSSNSDRYISADISKIYKDNSFYYHYLGITVNAGHQINEVPSGVSKGLKRDYLVQEDKAFGTMDEECKGIKEIRISAAWMRGFTIDTDIPDDEPPAVAARIVEDKAEQKCLQYIICLPRPKRVAIIAKEDLPSNISLLEGCKVFPMKSPSFEVLREVSDYELIVYISDNSDNCMEKALDADYFEWRQHLGSRWLFEDNFSECVENCKTEEGIGKLYSKWLNKEFCDEFHGTLPQLIINDSKSFGKQSQLLEDGRVEWNDNDRYSNQLVYSKHYSGQPNIKEYYKDALFLEGVSGGNSSDRLVRQEEWTEEWYVKHMTAALTRVAIIDERIFNKFVRNAWDKNSFDQWLEQFGDCVDYVSFETKFRKEYGNDIPSETIDLLYDDTCNDNGLDRLAQKDSERRKAFHEKMSLLRTSDYSVAEIYREKGIWAFGIEVKGNEASFWGYDNEKEALIKVASVSRVDKAPRCQVLNKSYLKRIKKFHFIAIHQGILDKIYRALDCVDVMDKNIVTREIFEKFSLKKEFPNGFLPQFIIHSGRSKPNIADMPQHQPFLQFSAMDHAVRDCKYTLTELLYSAHYEESCDNY